MVADDNNRQGEFHKKTIEQMREERAAWEAAGRPAYKYKEPEKDEEIVAELNAKMNEPQQAESNPAGIQSDRQMIAEALNSGAGGQMDAASLANMLEQLGYSTEVSSTPVRAAEGENVEASGEGEEEEDAAAEAMFDDDEKEEDGDR